VPQCTAHRLENPGVIKLVLIEVQNGEYLGEDDIVRFQDDYARHQS
jgi:mannose-6-phosphate isomerase